MFEQMRNSASENTVPDRAGPLSGLRIIEIESLAPAPFACMLMAQMGADVLTIRRPAIGDGSGHDLLDRRGPIVDPLQQWRTNLTLDLRDPASVGRVHEVTAHADVFVEGFRPGVAERLGIGPDELRSINPRLVYARMTGWGQSGPRASFVGHDINYMALAGALDPIGTSDGPVPPLNLVGDFGGGGMYLALGVLAALHDREHSGLGDVIDVAMVDGIASLMTHVHGLRASGGWINRRASNSIDGGAPFYTTYPTSDGLHVAVGAIEPRFFSALLDVLELDPTMAHSQWERNGWGPMRTVFAERFAARTRDHWDRRCTATEACVTPVLGVDEVAENEHIRARGTFSGLAGGFAIPAAAPRFGKYAVARSSAVGVDELLSNWRNRPAT